MNDTRSGAVKPHVLMFKSPGCPHCPTVLKIFTQFEQAGRLAELQIHDVSVDTELAAQYGVRSVPWFRIEALEFQGLHSAAELDYWVSHATSRAGIRHYLIEQLEAGHLQAVGKLLRTHPDWLDYALEIVADLQSPMQARIGIGAVLEDMAGTPALAALVPALGRLTQHADHSVRIDACHYLGLSADPAARVHLEACLEDDNAEVREVARESLAALPA